MISAEVESHRLTYMTYPDPWRGTPKQQQSEFLRPQPKPLALNKYTANNNNNGLNISSSTNSGQSGPNGTRLIQRPPSKYSPPASAPVNLTQHQMKEEIAEELPYSPYRNFSQYNYQYHQMYPHYQPMFRPTYVQTQTIPLENYTTTPIVPNSTNSGTFLSPPAAYSPPKVQASKPQQERRVSNRSPPNSIGTTNFKVPSGKEGSLKHRLLLRPEETQKCAIDLHKSSSSFDFKSTVQESPVRKRLSASALSPPRSPAAKTAFNPVLVNIAKGCLIQLENGDFKKLEEMKTEDFVHSAEISPELRLADSTVVKIGENPITGSVTITLTYNQRRTEAEVEYPLEHPFFVYGKGWASCNPDRTLKTYSLKVHRLQVGDVIISLTPRTTTTTPQSSSSSSTNSIPSTSAPSPADARTCYTTRIGATYTTTATTTAMTVRQVQTGTGNAIVPKVHTNHSISHITKQSSIANTIVPVSLTTSSSPSSTISSISPDFLMKKRRWSAPGQIGEEDEDDNQTPRKAVKVE